jgi:RNA polymerase sigma factor (sigma-70 family)
VGTISNQRRLLPFAGQIIQRKASILSGKYGFLPSDIEDIAQDFWWEVMRRANHFDPEKGSEVQFIQTVVNNACASLIERQKAVKRGFGIPITSIDAEISPDDPSESTLHDIVDRESYLNATRSSDTTQSRQHDLRIDLDAALQSLPPSLQDLARRLRGSSVSEVARETGIPRTSLNDRIRKIRLHLKEQGLGEYFGLDPSDD